MNRFREFVVRHCTVILAVAVPLNAVLAYLNFYR